MWVRVKTLKGDLKLMKEDGIAMKLKVYMAQKKNI